MKNFWKKTGLTCLTILPGIISFLAQMGIGILVLLFCYVIAMAQ